MHLRCIVLGKLCLCLYTCYIMFFIIIYTGAHISLYNLAAISLYFEISLCV